MRCVQYVCRSHPVIRPPYPSNPHDSCLERVFCCFRCYLQGLAYKGWLDINWRKIGSDTAKALDTDGDGKVRYCYSCYICVVTSYASSSYASSSSAT